MGAQAPGGCAEASGAGARTPRPVGVSRASFLREASWSARALAPPWSHAKRRGLNLGIALHTPQLTGCGLRLQVYRNGLESNNSPFWHPNKKGNAGSEHCCDIRQ